MAVMTVFLTSAPKIEAASVTKLLKPGVNIPNGQSSGAAGIAYGDFQSPAGTTVSTNIFGGEITDFENMFYEDGQTVKLNPSNPGPGDDQGDSYLFVNYDKTAICSQAVITGVNVHVVWSQSQSEAQNDAFALLLLPDPSNQINFTYVIPTATYTLNNTLFGGVASPVYQPQAIANGNPPSALTHESGATWNVPTYAQLTDPEARIVISVGEESSNSLGEVDTTWLEVTYDDTACNPSVPTSTTASPQPPATRLASTGSNELKMLLAGVMVVSFSAAIVLALKQRKSGKVFVQKS